MNPRLSRRGALLTAASFALSASVARAAVKAPQLGAVRLMRPADPYNDAENADKAIAAAKARAKKAGKMLLIDMGGNWCVDCLVLTAVMSLPGAKTFIDSRFEVVTVDVGRFDKNLQVPARYGIQMKAVPCVVVLDPAGRQTNKGEELALGSASQLSPQAVLDQLAAWIR